MAIKSQHLTAYIYSILGNVLFALGVVLEKLIINRENLNLINSLRFATGVLILCPIAIWTREPCFGVPGERLKVTLWMLAFAASEILIQYSYSMINASAAVAIRMTFPFAVNIISIFLLKTRFQKVIIISAMLAGGGIYLIDEPVDAHLSQNSGINFKVLGVCLAFLSTAIYSFCPVVSNMMEKSSVTVPLVAYHAVVFLVSLINAISQETVALPEDDHEWAVAIISGGCCTIGIFLCYVAYKIGEPRVQAAFGLLEIPSVFLLEMAVLSRRPTWINAAGVLLIMVSVALTTMQDAIGKVISALACKKSKEAVKPSVFLVSYAYANEATLK